MGEGADLPSKQLATVAYSYKTIVLYPVGRITDGLDGGAGGAPSKKTRKAELSLRDTVSTYTQTNIYI